MKKHLLLLVMFLLPIVASAHDIEVQNAGGVTIYYNYINNGTELEVTYYGNGNDYIYYSKYTGNVVIPEEVTYMNKTHKVKSIGVYAFYKCSALTSITIPNSVTSIGGGAFSGCSALTSITLPNSVTSIGGSAFMSCGLTSITIPNSVTNIYEGTFYGCSALTSVTIPNSVTNIGRDAFQWCFGLTSVHISDLEAWCKIQFSNINETSLESNPLYYAHHLYLNGEEIKDLVIPNNVMSIERCAFVNCVGLTSVTIPNSVTSIGVYAFSGCSGLTSVTIPNSVTSIDHFAFSGCSSLTSVIIPNSMTSIGAYAFRDCFTLTSITIPNSVTNIYEGTFYGCSGLTSVAIPNSITNIGQEAFYGCSGLSSVTIGNSVKNIGNYAFYNCSALTSVHISDLEAWYNIHFWSKQSNPLYYAHHLFVNGEEIKDLVIPNSVTSIGDYAFNGCSGLTSILIPSSVTSIGNAAFAGCGGLSSIKVDNNIKYDSRNNCNAIIETSTNKLISGCKKTVIPNSVTSIGQYAFSGSSDLVSITIPNSVTSIGHYAFEECSGLTSITIPNSVTNIGSSVFSGCVGLATIKIESGNTIYDSRDNCNAIIETSTNTLISGCKNTVIPNSVTSIGSSAFQDCSALTSITIPKSVICIGDAAFYGCSNLSFVMIPNSVTSIGQSAFANCTSLTSVVIPNSVNNIGYTAFWGCSSLTSVNSRIVNPLYFSEFHGVFYGISPNAVLLVPKGTKSQYENYSGWTMYFKEVVEESDFIEDFGFICYQSLIRTNVPYINGQDIEELYLFNYGNEESGGIYADTTKPVYVVQSMTDHVLAKGHFEPYPEFGEDTGFTTDVMAVKLVLDEPLTDYIEEKLVDFNEMPVGAYNGTIEKGKATIANYDNQNVLQISKASNVRIIENFEVDPLIKYAITFWAKAEKDATFTVTFSGNKIEGTGTNGSFTMLADKWTKFVVEAYSAEDVTEGYLRIENTRSAVIYISKAEVGYYSEYAWKNATGNYGYVIPAGTLGDKNFKRYLDCDPTVSSDECHVNGLNNTINFYVDNSAANIGNLFSDELTGDRVKVFSLGGQLLIDADRNHWKSHRQKLPVGMYILNGKKFVVTK